MHVNHLEKNLEHRNYSINLLFLLLFKHRQDVGGAINYEIAHREGESLGLKTPTEVVGAREEKTTKETEYGQIMGLLKDYSVLEN